jgi:hypothetical protein
VDISAWQVCKGKLYLNLNPGIHVEFQKDKDGAIVKGEANHPDF